MVLLLELLIWELLFFILYLDILLVLVGFFLDVLLVMLIFLGWFVVLIDFLKEDGVFLREFLLVK